jgi:transcriptional regulator with XRE-family HTH domain
MRGFVMAKQEIDNDAFDFGHRLQELRRQCGLTQQQVADRINCHVHTIGAYENNTRKPSHTVLKKLAFIYHTTTDYILDFTGRAHIYIDDLPQSKQDMITALVQAMREEEEHRSRNEKTGD